MCFSPSRNYLEKVGESHYRLMCSSKAASRLKLKSSCAHLYNLAKGVSFASLKLVFGCLWAFWLVSASCNGFTFQVTICPLIIQHMNAEIVTGKAWCDEDDKKDSETVLVCRRLCSLRKWERQWMWWCLQCLVQILILGFPSQLWFTAYCCEFPLQENF